jgi:hypothetical protein
MRSLEIRTTTQPGAIAKFSSRSYPEKVPISRAAASVTASRYNGPCRFEP